MLSPLGLRLAPEKTRVVHIDEGFDFLGHHIRRQRKRGTSKYYVYTKPSKKAIRSIKQTVKEKTYRSTRHLELDELLRSLNQTLAGWANFFRYGVSKAIFTAVDYHAWSRLMRWIRAKYAGKHRLGMNELRRRFCDQGCASPTTGSCSPAQPASRWNATATAAATSRPHGPRNRQPPQAVDQRVRHAERPVLRDQYAGCGRGPRETDRWQHRHRARGPTSPTR